MTVTRIGHIGLVVENLEAYATHLVGSLGMRETRREGGCAYFTFGVREHEVRVREGDSLGCDGIGFDVRDEAGLEELRGNVVAAGFQIVAEEPASAGIAAGFSFALPQGPTVELCLGAGKAPENEGQANDFYRLRRDGLRLKKLGHVTIGSPDPEMVEKAFIEILGFRLSDRFPGFLAWARCNSDHHNVGFAPAKAPGVHHLAFELESFAYYELLLDHLARRGTRLVWGPGRHGPGNNLFAYFEDPAGNLVEIYSDMIRIDDEGSYQQGVWDDLQEVGNSWGPLPEQSWFEMLTPFTSTVTA